MPGGRPRILTDEQREESRIRQNKRRTARTLARRTAQRAAKALAEGRIPGQVGQPRVLTDEQRKINRLATWAKYRAAKLEIIRAKDAAAHRRARAERALAEGRVPGVIGHLNTFTAEELANYLSKWRGDDGKFASAIHTQNNRAKRLGVPGKITVIDILKTLEEQQGHCAFCGSRFGDETPELDHWVPLSRGGTNHPANIKLLHGPCNKTKGARHPADLRLESLLLKGELP